MDLRSIGKNFKRIDYDFDLISGKVNQVNYQKDSTDQFIHQYQYDADNRITNVLTTADGITWENEASYFYYRHGPLARIEIGQRQVQGIDYAYTLQGWIKGVNASTAQNGHDMSGDAYQFSGKHKYFGQDAYSYTLGYFENDYTRIYTGTNPTAFELAYASKPFNTGSPSLYNGNIRHAVYGLPLLPNTTMGYAYNYDQLNRLVRMDAFKDAKTSTGFYEWKDSTATTAYQERISYDPNGNILKYLRNGQSSTLKMDSLKYSYYANTNKLAWVHDSVGASNYAGKIDIDNQSTGNYTYDAIGNLTTDASEGLTIWWNNYGKIDSIRNSKDTTALRYRYDAMGNRIEKRFYKLASDSIKYTEYYVRDAQGNIMANYKQKAKGVAALDSLRLTELPIYGSSRLGVYNRDTLLYTNASGKIGTKKDTVTFNEGKKQYELSNHLGNVLVTITDRKYPQDDNNDTIADWYSPVVLTENDYYPFGMPMPGRSNSTTAYRYGFNIQEKDDEICGTGNTNTAEFWEYSTRLGRRWNLDPKPVAGVSGYAVNRDNPILASDPLGDSPEKQRERAQRKFDKKITQPLKELETSGGTPAQVQAEADRLADKYQNTRWLHFTYGVANPNNPAGKSYTSTATGMKNQQKIGIKAYYSTTTNARDVDVDRPTDGSSVSIGTATDAAGNPLNATAGSTVNVQFDPYAVPNSLAVFTTTSGTGLTPTITTTGGMIKDDVFNTSTVITTTTAGQIQYRVENTSTDPTRDTWNLKISVTSPPVLKPTPIIVSNYPFR